MQNAYTQAGSKLLNTPHFSKIGEIMFVCEKFNVTIEKSLDISDIYVTLAMTKNTLSNNIEAEAQRILSKL